jgi:hypothetical protein
MDAAAVKKSPPFFPFFGDLDFLATFFGDLDFLATFFGDLDFLATFFGDLDFLATFFGDLDFLATFFGDLDFLATFFGDLDFLAPPFLALLADLFLLQASRPTKPAVVAACSKPVGKSNSLTTPRKSAPPLPLRALRPFLAGDLLAGDLLAGDLLAGDLLAQIFFTKFKKYLIKFLRKKSHVYLFSIT